MLRVVTALAVVGVHSASFTLGFYRSPLGAQLQNGLVVALHFTRETFLSIAAFVLVYSYAGKPFWRKRGVGVLFPYVVWSFLYVWFAVPHDHPASWLRTALVATLTGNASYQLYYILLSLELYLTVPLLLPVVTRLGRQYPWRLVAASGVAQVLFFSVDHRFVEAAPFALTPLGQFINAAQWRFLPCYQFYVVLGAVAALHVERVRAFVLRRGRLLGLGLLLGLGALWLRYGIAIWVERQSVGVTNFFAFLAARAAQARRERELLESELEAVWRGEKTAPQALQSYSRRVSPAVTP